MPTEPLPLTIQPAPDPADDELAPLLAEPFASAWAADDAATAAAARRGRLLERLAASRAASAAMLTSRAKQRPWVLLAPGVSAQVLHAAPAGRAPRPGEPRFAHIVELQPGSCWSPPAHAGWREWLVLQGSVRIGDEWLQLRDHHAEPAGQAARSVMAGDGGARLFVRESAHAVAPGDTPRTVRDAEAGWPAFAPGIRRRVLWQHGSEAAMLYLAEAGAAVPGHRHGHDEECLMVQGELFLDDLLLQTGDYQLAPAGTGHRITATDTGVVIYAHGDLDLQFTP